MHKHIQEKVVWALVAFVLQKVGDSPSLFQKTSVHQGFELNQTSCAAPGAKCANCHLMHQFLWIYTLFMPTKGGGVQKIQGVSQKIKNKITPNREVCALKEILTLIPTMLLNREWTVQQPMSFCCTGIFLDKKMKKMKPDVCEASTD